MGKINIYNTLDASFQTINGNGKLSDLLPTENFNNAVILKAGNRLSGDYEVQPDDIIFMRKIPRGADPLTWFIVAAVVIIGGGIGAALVDNKLTEQQEKAQRDAQNLASQINQLPFIKGAQNRSALGYSVPYLIGDMYHTPYKMTDGFYSIANGTGATDFGTKQYYNVVLNLGYGAQQVKELLIGSDSILKNNSGITEGQHYFDEDSVFYDAENKVELCQPETDFTLSYFGKKVVCTQDGTEIKHPYDGDAEPVIRTLSDYTKTVEVCIQFNGLRKYNSSDSKWVELENNIIPYWTNKENPKDVDWEPFTFDGMTNNKIKLNTNKTIRFVARKTFTAEEAYGKTIKIKVVKANRAESTNSNESVYLAYYQSFCYDNKLSTASNLVDCKTVDENLTDKTTRIGIRLIANDNTKDTLNEIHALVCGLARTWDGTNWSVNKTPTRNPAAWLLEIMTSPAHKHSQFADSELDLDSFGAFYRYCSDNSLYTDAIFTDGNKKQDILATILDACNAAMILNADGKWEVCIDQAEETPVALLNSESISNISYSKDLSRQPDGLKVTFTNRNNWQVDTFYVKTDGTARTQNDTFNELNLDYVTTYEHAYKIAIRALKQMKLQPKELTVDVGRDGDYYPLYSTVMLQYTILRTGLNSSVIAGLIKDNNGNITGVTLSDSVVMEAGKNYGLIIQTINNSGKKHFYKSLVFSAGTSKTVTFNTAISVSEEIFPAIGDTVSYGELDSNSQFSKITDVMKITGIAPNDSYGYKLTLKNYNANIYETGSIPDFKSNITEPPKPVKEIPNFEKLEGEPGENGYSSYTLQLFKRYSGEPSLPSGQLTYTFNPPSLSGDLEGWQQSMPEVDDDNNPLYESHVTIINQNNSVVLTAADFSEPVIVLKDSNITIAEIQEMINKVTPPPSVDADVTFFGIQVNEQGIATKAQSITTEIHVRQIEEELGFSFGDIVLPDGYSYLLDGNKITITVAAGTYVKSGSFILPVKYKAYKANVAYVNNADANDYYIGSGNILGNYDDLADLPTNPAEDSIINWIGEDTPMSRASDDIFENNTAYQFVSGKWQKFDFTPYGYYVYESDYSISNIGIGYTQVKGFRYFDSINSLSNIPVDVIIGDWFTWTGEDTSSSIVVGGIFKQCCLYAWNGDKWEIDTTTDHNTRAIFDILELAESKLSDNNTKAQTFLDRLCANQAFIKTLVVTGSAFINQLSTINLTLQENGLIKSENFSDTLNTGFKISADGKAVFNDVKVRGDVVANSLTIGSDVSIPEENIEGLTQSLESKVDNSTIFNEENKINKELIETSSLNYGDTTLGEALDNKANTGAKLSTFENDTNFQNTQQVIQAKKDAIDNTLKQLVGADKVQDQTIVADGYILGDLIKANIIKVGDKFLVSEESSYLNADLIETDKLKVGDETLIDDNGINAKLIDVDKITSQELVLHHTEESSGIIKSENYEDIETVVKITYQALVPDGKGTKFVYADNFEDLTSSSIVYGYGIIIKNKETEQQIESIFDTSIYYYCDDVKDNDESKYILWGKNGNIETDSKKFIHIKYGDSTTYYLLTYKLFNTYKGFKIDTNGNAEFYGDTVIGGNARIDGVFNSIGGYRYNNSVSWITGSLDMDTVMNKVKSIFGDYYGKVHCSADLIYYKTQETIYICRAVTLQQYTNGGFRIEGYASLMFGDLYYFSASFHNDDLWITIGKNDFHNAQGKCTLEIYY